MSVTNKPTKINVDGKQYPLAFVCKKIRTTLKLSSAVYNRGNTFLCDGDMVAVLSGNHITSVITGKKLDLSQSHVKKTHELIDNCKKSIGDFTDSADFYQREPEGFEPISGKAFAIGWKKDGFYESLHFADADGTMLNAILDKDTIDTLVKPYNRPVIERRHVNYTPRSEEVAFALADMQGSDILVRTENQFHGKVTEPIFVEEQPSEQYQFLLSDDGQILTQKYTPIKECDCISVSSMSDEFREAFADIIDESQMGAKTDYTTEAQICEEIIDIEDVVPSHFVADKTARDVKRQSQSIHTGERTHKPRKHDNRTYNPADILSHAKTLDSKSLIVIYKPMISQYHDHGETERHCNICVFEDVSENLEDTMVSLRGMEASQLTVFIKTVETAMDQLQVPTHKEPVELSIAKSLLKAKSSHC